MPDTARNVLLISVDQWSGSILGCAGHPVVETPTLDYLAQAGIRYPNAYSECPVCVPARRTWMSGLHPDQHNVLVNRSANMPEVPTLAQCFRDQGYQAYAVGKLHVHPQRNRIGFDDVILDEEGRGKPDDYALFLGDQGYPGQRFANGMGNNCYEWRPWHLPERLHPTNWATEQMCRVLRRKDPTRPGFWYLSYSFPHPPLAPLRDYVDMYRDVDIPLPQIGQWAEQPDIDDREYRRRQGLMRAYLAQCTHIDHQIRLVIGTLREMGELDQTVIAFTADHGEQLGTHGLWAKSTFLEESARIPFLVIGATDDQRFQAGSVDQRLVGQEDLLPSLLDAAGLPAADHATGRSCLSETPRQQILGCHGHRPGDGPAGNGICRMLRSDRYKLIWQPAGNILQLFDMHEDRQEMHNLVCDSAHAATLEEMSRRLVNTLSECDRAAWVRDNQLVGTEVADNPVNTWEFRHLRGQRGIQWPPS